MDCSRGEDSGPTYPEPSTERGKPVLAWILALGYRAAMKESVPGARSMQLPTTQPLGLGIPRSSTPERRNALVIGLACMLCSACTSLKFERTGPDHGTFTSSAATFTFLSFDVPGPARDLAMGNAADSARPNLLIESDVVVPYLGWFDWVFDIIGVRYARVTGTWGTPVAETTASDARPGSNR